MFRSIARGLALAAFLLAGVAEAQQDSQREPRTRVDWIREGEKQDEITTVQPFPDLPDIPSEEESADAGTEADLDRFNEALIGIDELPEPVASGISPRIWNGTDDGDRRRALADAALTYIHAANRLLITILLTPAEEEDIATARARALLELGAVPEAIRVAGSVNPPDPDALAILILGKMLLGEGESACLGTEAAHGALLPSGPEGVFCAAVRDQLSSADVRLGLLRSAGEVDDLEHQLLAEAVFGLPGHAVMPDSEVPLSNFAAALLAHLDHDMPDWWNPAQRPPQLWLAMSGATTPAERLEILASLESLGLVATDRLTQSYLDPEAELEGSRATLARVLAASERLLGNPRYPEVLASALQRGREEGREGQTARILASVASKMLPGDSSARTWLSMQRLLLLAGDFDGASLWVPSPPTTRERLLLALAGHADGTIPDGYEAPAPLDRRLVAALSSLSGEERQATAVDALEVLAGLRSGLAPENAAALLQELLRAEFRPALRQIAVEIVLLGD